MPQEFRTTFEIEESKRKITYNDKLLLIGSCFTEHIGKRLSDLKFQSLVNPFGVIFNPISLEKNLNRLLIGQFLKESDLQKFNDEYFHFDFHGRFRTRNKTECLQNINQQIEAGNRQLNSCHFLFISFGTAQVYQLNETSEIVANCHKLPQKYFSKVWLEPDKIAETYKGLLKRLKELNPALQVCFTLSPVKYLKDGIVSNNLSKSILLVAIQKLVEDFDFCSYFPAFELLTDDLRDYRFYADDMAHPNEQAINYIWDSFKKTYIDEEVFPLMKIIENIESAVQHKPLHPQVDEFQHFAKSQLQIIEEVQKLNKNLRFDAEKAHFETLINHL